MQGKMTVQFKGGATETVEIGPSDAMRLERAYDIAAGDLGGEGASLKVEYLLFLAYTALRRTGKAGDDFDQWADLVTTLDLDPEEAASAAPLDQGATTTSSRRSSSAGSSPSRKKSS